MLKKLVKYGNSNALVLDKPILELLEIGEGGIVKIKTDGKSLIITPHTVSSKEEKISTTLTYEDALHTNLIGKMLERYTNVPAEKKEALIEELRSLNIRRAALTENSPQFKAYTQAVQELVKKHTNHHSPEFQQEYMKLREIVPELTALDNEMANFEKKHGLIAKKFELPSEDQRKAAQEGQKAVTKLLKKYEPVQEKIKLLPQNHDYMHEMQLLVEKYGKNEITSAACLKDTIAIRDKYVPGAKAMDEAMQKLAKKYSMFTIVQNEKK